MDQILRSSQNVSEKAEQFSYKNFTIWGIDFMKITFLKNIPFVFLTDFIHFNFELFVLPAIKFAILFLNHTLKNKFLNVNCAINLSSVEMCAVEMYYWIYKLLSKHMFRLELLPQRIFSLFFHRKHQIWTNIVRRRNRCLKNFSKISEATLTRTTAGCVYLGDLYEIFLTYLPRNM